MPLTEHYSGLVAGANHIEGIDELLKAMTPCDELTLVREPDNEFDANAIRIEDRGVKIGYVPRVANGKMAAALDRGADYSAHIFSLDPHPPEGMPAPKIAIQIDYDPMLSPIDAPADNMAIAAEVVAMPRAEIVVRQLPIIEEHLRELKPYIEDTVKLAYHLEATADTVAAVSKTRAEINKQYLDLEMRRKDIKREVLAPYESFEAVYNECVTEVFKPALAALDKKIADVNDGIKNAKRKEIEDYFNEYQSTLSLPFAVSFARLNLNITKSTSAKAMKTEAKNTLDRIKAECDAIATMDDRDELMVEYQQSLNLGQAAKIVADRKAAKAEAAKAAEIAAAAKAERVAAAARVQEEAARQALAPAVEVKAERVYTTAFEASGTKEQLTMLKQLMAQSGCTITPLCAATNDKGDKTYGKPSGKVKVLKFTVAIQTDGYKKLINSTLQDPKRARQFVAAITSAVSANPGLQECDAASIISSAFLGESLNLSPSPQLGQYYLVPFNDRESGGKKAQFILGYKGMLQLAQRSGQYKKIGAYALKEGEVLRYNMLEEELEYQLIEDDLARDNTPTVGYYAMFEYHNGFRKTIYWTKKKMLAHADRYSKAFNAAAYEQLPKDAAGQVDPSKLGYKQSSFWYKDFDSMALKTMLRQLISKWGVMSIDMEIAETADGKGVANWSSAEGASFIDAEDAPEQLPEPEQEPAYTIDTATGEILNDEPFPSSSDDYISFDDL